MEQELFKLGIETKITMLIEELLNKKKITAEFSLETLDELTTLFKLYEQFKLGKTK
jgi:hypothetical protein